MHQANPFLDETTDDFKVVFLHTRGERPLDFHFHESYEVYLCLTPQMDYLVNEQVYHLTVGDVLIFNSDDIHKALPPVDSDYKRALLMFNPSIVQSISTSTTDLLEFFSKHPSHFNHKIHLDSVELKRYQQLLDEGSKYHSTASYGNDIRQIVILLEIILLLNEKYRAHNDTSPSQGRYDEQLNRILVYLHAHYQETLTLDSMAKYFNLNKNQLNRIFKRSTGNTIGQYIINYRILIAKRYLKNGESVTTSAEKVGFNNLSHFIRTFHHIVGVSPKQYAKQSV